MRTSTGYLKQWTVVNNPPDDDGEDGRTIIAEFAVPPNSTVALAVAGLYNRKALLGVSLSDTKGANQVIGDVACTISPPWGAKRNGVFTFRATVPFSVALVRGLTSVTEGMPLAIALENAEHEMNLDPDQAAVVGFLAGG